MLPRIANVFDRITLEDEQILLRRRCDSQSLSFYADISHFISRRIEGAHTLSLLDVGPRTGVGLAFLRLLHHPNAFTRLHFDPVVGIDLDPAFEHIADAEFPDIKSITGNIFDLEENSFDIVTCSHTIEHLEEAEIFVTHLKRISRKYVIIACPFEENEPLTYGHVRRIGMKFFKSVGVQDIEVYEAPQFSNGMCCLAFLKK
ncbi:methyltransferase domain-containing protein [Azospirillum formosense]|uniref:Methyltransferase domain-containing protein n=1 Tax=Azospirillum formosense TaxID=861533 RepID=A0ABX2KWT9_9PROT|nr:methyltransferase domain-containing protein [Azospirillum formosense]MBY3757666.1 methyltransferase domain-containing protein [Azospirillum formosense]NUB20157.1 methyltransferase domain-containing protein [Azospirillum formosense]